MINSQFRVSYWPLVGVFAALIVYFFPVISFQQAFLSGDHWEQQYPWTAFMQQMLHMGELPWWTTRIGSGFPILAEGQIGAFYPLNWIFYYFLPLKIAYSGIILFHYFLGSFLFYAFARSIRLSPAASFFSTLIYVFGSTQCGYFYYNYISQKTVIWLPLALLLLNRIRSGGGFWDALALASVLALSMFGGYIQVALYLWAYVFFFFIFFFVRRPSRCFLFWSIFAATTAVGISLLQILPTVELASLASRASLSKEFAYVGSMSPLGMLTLIFPAWDGWFRSELYLSVSGLFLAIIGIRFRNDPDGHRIFFSLSFFIFLLLALGKFSPLYRAIVELTDFSGFRTPIKFLFFTGFSGAILCGIGWDEFQRMEKTQKLKWVVCTGFIFLPVVLSPFWAPFLLEKMRVPLIHLIQEYVVKYIYNQPGHPHSAEYYVQGAAVLFDAFYHGVSWKIGTNLKQMGVCFASFAALIWIAKTSASSTKKVLLLAILLIVDLFFYGTTSIRPNLQNYSEVIEPGKMRAEMPFLYEEANPFRVSDYLLPQDAARNFPLFPSQNMVHEIDHLGLYTPLAIKNWQKLMRGLVYVNDSVLADYVDPKIFQARLNELSVLNVKYLFSSQPLVLNGWEERKAVPIHVYENKKALPRYFFYPKNLPDDLMGIDLDSVLRFDKVEITQSRVEISGRIPRGGWIIGSDVNYPGWKAQLNGKPIEMRVFDGLFRAIQVESAGPIQLVLRYEPTIRIWARYGVPLWGGMFLLSCGYLIFFLRRANKC